MDTMELAGPLGRPSGAFSPVSVPGVAPRRRRGRRRAATHYQCKCVHTSTGLVKDDSESIATLHERSDPRPPPKQTDAPSNRLAQVACSPPFDWREIGAEMMTASTLGRAHSWRGWG